MKDYSASTCGDRIAGVYDELYGEIREVADVSVYERDQPAFAEEGDIR